MPSTPGASASTGVPPAPAADVHGEREQRVKVLAPDQRVSFRELWEHRDLLYFLAWRDVKVRYAQSVMGVGWAVAQPLLMMGLFAVVLGVLAKVPAPDGVNYPVFVLAGLVPWTFFVNAVGAASDSLVGSSNLVSKVYFPRLLVPLAALVAWLPDLVIAFVLLLGAMAVTGVTPGWAVVTIPLFFGFAILTTAAAGTWLSALNVAYRDVRYAVPFLLQLGMFATPVVYSSELVPESVRTLYGLNPMVGVVEGVRWALLGGVQPHWPMMAVSGAVVILVFATGVRYFRRVERYFADVI